MGVPKTKSLTKHFNVKENYISVVKLFVVYFKFYESIIILGQAYIFKYLCHHLQEITVMKKKPGLKQFPWFKTIFVFLDPDYKKYFIF